jgi:hypothetical protein
MHRARTLLVALFAPAAGLAQEPDSVARAWRQVVATLPSRAESAAALLNRTYALSGIPLTYWVATSVPNSARGGLSIVAHPCGVVALIQSPTIPPTDRRLEAERVVELDSAGHELRQWPVSTDLLPLGLRGNELLMTLHVGDRHDLALAVSSDGTYRVVPRDHLRETELVTCPPYNGFGRSAYVRCLRVRRRLLAYEGPCT